MVKPPRIASDTAMFPSEIRVVDARASMLCELFSIRNPSLKKKTPEYVEKESRFVSESGIPSVYVFYPWLNKAVRMLPEEEYFELRTARNKDVITKEEQEKFRKGSVAVAGLSVGSSVVNALVMSGGPQRMKIADFDHIEATNLNRLRAGVASIGEPKTDVVAKAVWELDPYATLELYDKGVETANVSRFVGDPRVDIVIDEMESIEQKVRVRLAAKEKQVPVLMATDNGNGIVLDVERFDLEPDRALFHGAVVLPDLDSLSKLSPEEWLRLATSIVGPEYLEKRMQESILKIGRTLSSVPQLGASASLAGVAIAYATCLILCHEPLPSGRYAYSLEELVDPAYTSLERKEERARAAESFIQKSSSRS